MATYPTAPTKGIRGAGGKRGGGQADARRLKASDPEDPAPARYAGRQRGGRRRAGGMRDQGARSDRRHARKQQDGSELLHNLYPIFRRNAAGPTPRLPE